MWLPPLTTVAPVGAALPLEAMKEFLSIDADIDIHDGTLEALAEGIAGEVEAITGTRLLTQTVLLRASGFADLERLPIGPVQEVTSIDYVAATGLPVAVPSSVWELKASGLVASVALKPGQAWPVLGLWQPVEDAVRITATVGHGPSSASIPRPLFVAMLRGVRAAFDDKPFDLASTLTNYRVWL